MSNEITLDPTKIDVVAIDSVRANTWNPKDNDTKEFLDVKESIRLKGLRGFIIVREKPIEGSKYEIIDGEQRWRACKELGFEKIIIYNEGEVSDKEAIELTVTWQAQVPFNELSIAKLVTTSIEKFGEFQSYFSEQKIKEMQELAKFDFEAYKNNAIIAPPPQQSGELLKSFMVQVTSSQYDIIQQALGKAKKASEAEITDSKALEFVCAEYLNALEGTVS